MLHWHSAADCGGGSGGADGGGGGGGDGGDCMPDMFILTCSERIAKMSWR